MLRTKLGDSLLKLLFQSGIVGVLVTAVLIGVTLQISPEHLKVLADCGTFLAGLSTFLLVLIAIWQVPNGIKQWRLQRNHDTRSKIAIDAVDLSGPVVGAAIRLIKGTLDPNEQKMANYFQVFNGRLGDIQSDISNFYRLRFKLEIFFPDEDEKRLQAAVEEIHMRLTGISLKLQNAVVFGLRQPNPFTFSKDLCTIFTYQPGTPMIPDEVKQIEKMVENFNEALSKAMQR